LVLPGLAADAHAQGVCRRGRLPDSKCTPGRIFRGVTARAVCTPGYSQRVRRVSEATKREVYRRYGVRTHKPGQYEVDHLIPLELGGSNSIRNLFPEAALPRPGFHEKDRLENRLHRKVCAGKISLASAQREFKRNWVIAYRREFAPVPLP
jgi:hypothetical protein